MAETLVGTLEFTITGQDANIYKEDVEGTHQSILGRDDNGCNCLIIQFLIIDTATTQEILDAAEAKFNAKGWY